MSDTRKKNYNWTIETTPEGNTPRDDAHLATLMDIRDELQKLNHVFECQNFLQIPRVLQQIKTNTTKKRRRKLRIAK